VPDLGSSFAERSSVIGTEDAVCEPDHIMAKSPAAPTDQLRHINVVRVGLTLDAGWANERLPFRVSAQLGGLHGRRWTRGPRHVTACVGGQSSTSRAAGGASNTFHGHLPADANFGQEG
jgi:hypothetical protein